MKPKHTPETTGILPMRLAIFSVVARTSGAVAVPRTTSSNRMTLAGLKKCRPTTSSGLRVTAPRVAVLQRLLQATSPVSHGELAETLAPQWDRATIYRNLIDLTESGVLRRTDVGDHVWRFEVRADDASSHEDRKHPHFVCGECGDVPVDAAAAEAAASFDQLAAIAAIAPGFEFRALGEPRTHCHHINGRDQITRLMH